MLQTPENMPENAPESAASLMRMQRRQIIYRRAMGGVLLALLLSYAILKAQTGQLPEMLWASHVSSMLLALGLVLGLRGWSAAGFLFHLAVSLPVYLVYLLGQGDATWTSVLLHLLSPLAGWLAWRSTPLPAATCWHSWYVYLMLVLLCRLTTPEFLNINLAFKPWGYAVFGTWPGHLVNALLIVLQLTVVQWLFNRRLQQHR